MAGPLAGIRVLELGSLIAGPFCAKTLGDFGAEVIKIEPPAGDTLRAWRVEDVATAWKFYGRSKKSLCLDLHQPRQIDAGLADNRGRFPGVLGA